MMTIEEKRRELFEASMRSVVMAKWGYDEETVPEVMARGLNGYYSSIRVRGAWEGFNAAIDAVVIELPGSFPTHMGVDQLMRKDSVISAIESTGLGLKVIP